MADNLKGAWLSWARVRFLGKCSSLLLLFTVAALHGEDDPKHILLRVSQNVMETVERLPRYVCTQTVDRSRYEPERAPNDGRRKTHGHSCDDILAQRGKQRLSYSDRLRLDVAVSHDRSGADGEMYSWVGEGRFGGRDLFEIVPEGAMSTGTFSSMLASIFGGDAARFSYSGDSAVDGRLLSEFGFRIPQERSQYVYVFGNRRSQQMKLAYHGSFLVDPETSDLERVVIQTSQLPAETGTCEITRTLDYGHVRLGGADFLLPTEARLSIIHADGTVAENRIRYSACREFHSESRMRFEPLPEADPPRLVSEEMSALPTGLPFRLVFTEPINSATAAAGDPIKARLRTPIRDRSSKVLVPEGAAVGCRILSIKHFHATPRSSLLVTVALETLETAGIPRPLKAAFVPGAGRFVKLTGPLSVRVDIPLDRSQNSDAGVFEFSEANADYVVESGLESNWMTVGR